MKNNNYSEFNSIFGDMTIGDGSNSVRRRLCNKKVTSEISNDITLPDYLPEIRKLLRVNIIPSAPSKYVSGDSVQLGGGVDFNVCYVGADGGLYGASFPSEYSFSIPFDPSVEYDLNDGLSAVSDISVELAVSRVQSARKMNIKSRLGAFVTALGNNRVEAPVWTDDPVHSDTQKLVRKVAYSREMAGSNDEIELRDTVELGETGARYICSDCSVFVEEVRAGDGYADCRGTVKLKHMLCRENENTPYVVEKKLNLSEIIELDGLRDGMMCAAYGVCTGIDSHVYEGEGVNVECAVRLRLVARGYGDESLSYVADAYSTDYESQCELEELRLPVMTACANKNMTFTSSVPLEKLSPDGAKNGIKIADISVSVTGEGITKSDEGEKWGLGGDACFSIIYSMQMGDGGEELFSGEIELPFRMDLGTMDEGSSCDFCYACALDPYAKINGGELELGCEIAAAYSFGNNVNIERVTDVRLGDVISGQRRGVSICYPDKTDSLWSIAKRYNAPIEITAWENKLSLGCAHDSLESLEKSKYLII